MTDNAAVQREPAIRRPHPADDLPERPTRGESHSGKSPAKSSRSRTSAESKERMTEQHNVRIRPSTKERLDDAVLTMRFQTKDKSISLASITDAAINYYLDKKGC